MKAKFPLIEVKVIFINEELRLLQWCRSQAAPEAETFALRIKVLNIKKAGRVNAWPAGRTHLFMTHLFPANAGQVP